MMNKPRTTIHRLAFVIAVFLVPGLVTAASHNNFEPLSKTERSALFPSRDAVEFGRIAAEANCAACHGMDGHSQAAGEPNLAGQRIVYLYRSLKAFQSGKRADELKLHNNLLNDEALLSTAIYYSNLTPVSVPVELQDPAGANDEDLAGDPFAGIQIGRAHV